jgi:carbon-monoxide dehydrogenase medium subunit
MTVLPKFAYLRSATCDEAVRALADYAGEAQILAGGTDLLVNMKDGVTRPKYLIDIKHISEMRRIEAGGDGGLRIGACVTVNEVLEFKNLPPGMHALHEAASWLGTNQVRNRATVGGNLCNASPACDLGPSLLVLDARLRVLSAKGERTVLLKDFFTCPKETCLLRHELVTEILIPSSPGTLSGFAKRTRIRGHDLSVVNAAAAIRDGKHLRIALGAVAPKPLLIDKIDDVGLEETERILKIVLAAIAPIDDVRASGLYRRHMVEVLVRDVIHKLSDKAGLG